MIGTLPNEEKGRKKGGECSTGPAFNLPSQLVNTAPGKGAACYYSCTKDKMEDLHVNQQTRKPIGNSAQCWRLQIRLRSTGSPALAGGRNRPWNLETKRRQKSPSTPGKTRLSRKTGDPKEPNS